MCPDLYLSTDDAIVYLKEVKSTSLCLSIFGQDIRIQNTSLLTMFRRSSFEDAAKLLITRAATKGTTPDQEFMEKIEKIAIHSFGKDCKTTLREHEQSVLKKLENDRNTRESKQNATKRTLTDLFNEAIKNTVNLSEEELSFLQSQCPQPSLVTQHAGCINAQALQLRQEIENCQKTFLDDFADLCRRTLPLADLSIELDQLETQTRILVSNWWKKQAETYLPALNFLKKAIEEKKILEELIHELTQMMTPEFKLKIQLKQLEQQFSTPYLQQAFTEAWPKTLQNLENSAVNSWTEFADAPSCIQNKINVLIEGFRCLDVAVIKKITEEQKELHQAFEQLRMLWKQTLENTLIHKSFEAMSSDSSYKSTIENRRTELTERIHSMNVSPGIFMREAFQEACSFCLKQTGDL